MTEEEEMAADAVMIADLQIIAACGLSYCLSAVADVAMAAADDGGNDSCLWIILLLICCGGLGNGCGNGCEWLR